MSDETRDALETALDGVQPARRAFLRALLTGAVGAAALLAAPASQAVADDPPPGGKTGPK
jgi:hypothetical protein